MILTKNSKKFIFIASVMMALAVALGAFGAHGLKKIVSEEMLKVYNTGVQYHFYNTFGLFVLSFLLILKNDSKILLRASWILLIGMIIFSFSLYLLVILNMPILGAITPIGGTMLIISWLMIAYSFIKE